MFKKLLTLLTISCALVSCEPDGDPVIEAVEETESILRSNTWDLEELIVEVVNSDLPPPFFAAATDGFLDQGMYNAAQIFGEIDDINSYSIKFSTNKVLVDSAGSGQFAESGSYKIFSTDDIRLGFGDDRKLNYKYVYLSSSKTMLLDAENAGAVVEAYNRLFTRLVVNETPDKVGDAIAKNLFENERVREAINTFLVELISGKLSILNEIDPEAQADSIATVIFNGIDQIGWQDILSAAIETELVKITGLDPEEVSQRIAEEAVSIIQSRLSVDAIYDFILPFILEIDSKPADQVADNIAIVITSLIIEIFDQDKIEEIVFPIWERFTLVDSTSIMEVSDSLATIVEENWINEENLSMLFLPATTKIASTPTAQLGALAQEITDSLAVVINQINAVFPELNLSPDYDQIQSVVRVALVALKPIIGSVGAEAAADQIANLIIDTFLNHETLQNAFFVALNTLQSIDPGVAASTISEWLVNIIDRAEQSIIDFLAEELAPIVENADPLFTAFRIAKALNSYIEATINEEFIFHIILPKIEMLTEINAEEIADFLADVILGSNIIQDNVTKENIEMVLVPVLTKIANIDSEAAATQIINALVTSDIIKGTITEERVSWIISYVIYNKFLELFKTLNNFESVSISIRHD